MKVVTRALGLLGWLWFEVWTVITLCLVYDNWPEYSPFREQFNSALILNWLILLVGFAVGIGVLVAARKLHNRYDT